MVATKPDSKKPHRRVGLEESVVETTEEGDEQDPTTDKIEELDSWLLTITTGGKDNDGTTSTRGPTYKVNLAVEEVKVRGFLDHGAQVSLVRKELFPVIRKRHGWTLEECHKLKLKMGPQPIGATGAALGAVSLIYLCVSVEETGVVKESPVLCWHHRSQSGVEK